MPQSPTYQTATGGGAHIGQSVSSGRDFTGRDSYTIQGPATIDRRDAALTVYGEALTLYRAVGDRLGEANVLLELGDSCRANAQYPEAWAYYQDVERLYNQIGDRYSLARVLYRLGDWHAAQSQRAEAAPLYQQAIALWQAIDLVDLAESIITPRLQVLTPSAEREKEL